ncbi:MAG: DNA polymerase IV [Paracoccus sp. (in: a-proteobacteria)]|nr:DNA polymerase IV [Paracoccus sp. (in: a-proteobacteria)]
MTGPGAESAPDHDDAPIRKIVHIDMDAFYASVEQRDNPDLRGKPVAVGGSSRRGVVAAASYEARAFGVRSAMPSVTAARRCPELIFVRPRFDVYRAVSQQIREIFARFTPVIEPLSLDEAYLDLTAHLEPGQSATEVAARIRALIRAETGLTASAGISYNKFLAKIASDQSKPDGQFVITPARGPDFVATLPVRKFHGIGPATTRKMQALGIETGADLRAQSPDWLERHFGKAGRYYYEVSRGRDHRRVQPHRARKSIGAETTYSADLHGVAAVDTALADLAAKVWGHVTRLGAQGRTVTLKLRYADFDQLTRARSLPRLVAGEGEMLAMAQAMAAPLADDPRGIRLLGITLSGLSEAAEAHDAQLELFHDDGRGAVEIREMRPK